MSAITSTTSVGRDERFGNDARAFILPMKQNKFPLPDAAFNALHRIIVPDTRRYVFDQPVTVRHGHKEPVSFNAPSKRAAKSGKLAVKAKLLHGIQPAAAPEYAFRNAGLRHDTWQWRD